MNLKPEAILTMVAWKMVHWNRFRFFLVACLFSATPAFLSTAFAQSPRWPSPDWPKADPGDVGLDADAVRSSADYALSAGGSGMIIRHGRVIKRWGDQRKLYDIKSATKSFGSALLGFAVADGKVKLDAPAVRYQPSLGVPPNDPGNPWLKQITIRHLATQTAGFDKPGGYEKLLFKPGTKWLYSDGGPNWLAECITLAYQTDLQDLLFQRLCQPLGISRQDLRWRNNQYRPHQINGLARREFGAGIHANVEALSRFGYLFLHDGNWNGKLVLPASYVRQSTSPDPAVVGLPEYDPSLHGNASDHYGFLWWNNADGALKDVPRDAFWAWGLYDSLVVVIPSLDLLVIRAGERGRTLPRHPDGGHLQVLHPLLQPLVASAKRQETADTSSRTSSPPADPSPVISAVDWDPAGQIIRLAKGSDNWPLTWMDDGDLMAAYGDGWGFVPKVQRKLSLGLARIKGVPPKLRGVNVRSADAEQIGQGARGTKASGMLMVDGVLYMLVRNTDNARLAWSNDRGKTWQWSNWRWTTSFGCPTFLNFGKNNADARDEFVYVYSPDSDSAYEPADRMVLARVAKDKIREQAAYEYFVGLDEHKRPRWTSNIDGRGAVFRHPGRCYRSGITYNAVLGRYLWCQNYPESRHKQGPRFEGGFGIYDAPQPWGPWTMVFHTDHWDVGPGESSSIPTKWISDDGKRFYLVFSGDDAFSVRGGTLKMASPPH